MTQTRGAQSNYLGHDKPSSARKKKRATIISFLPKERQERGREGQQKEDQNLISSQPNVNVAMAGKSWITGQGRIHHETNHQKFSKRADTEPEHWIHIEISECRAQSYTVPIRSPPLTTGAVTAAVLRGRLQCAFTTCL